MNAQENVKVNESTAEQQPQEVNAAPQTQEETAKRTYHSKAEVVERLKEIVGNHENPTKEEIDQLKTTFYKMHVAEREAQQREYLEQGGDSEKYVFVPDELEEVFKAEMSVIKERRTQLFLQQEAEKQENLQKKLHIIERIKEMGASPEEANKNYNELKKLQQEWKEIKAVPAEKANELWRNYQLHVECFYDQLNLNREAREYDFKKNLEKKTHLCEAAEKLAEEKDVVSAFHQLQELHQQYRETGPVAKDIREEIWARFKAASTAINRRYQQHFEELRAKEEENLQRKTALCEQVEAIAKVENKTPSEWEKQTKAIIALQADWKKIGFAPQKMNVKIFERFRAACDVFFSQKAAFFKDLKQQAHENIAKKKALIEQVVALQDSTEWQKTTQKIIALQKEWKTIGTVPKKVGDELWKDFQTACNKFFEARHAAHADVHSDECENLKQKKAIITQLKALLDDAGEGLHEKVQALVEQYNKVGHVPFKEKDKLYQQYHEAINKLYDGLHVEIAKKHLDNFKTNLQDMAKRGSETLDNERGKLLRRYENLKQEIITYENNLGFLNSSSRKGNSLIEEMNRKVQRLKDEMELTKQKIKAIDKENQ